LILSTSWYNHP